MAFWLESRMSKRPSSGCVDSVVSVSSPRTTCANTTRSRAELSVSGEDRCLTRRRKEEDRFVMLSQLINVGARVVKLGAQRGSWRSTAGIQLLRKLADHHEPGRKAGRLPAIAHDAFLRSRAESSRGARDGVVAGAVAAGGGHLFWAVCFRGGLFVVWGFGLEKAFFPFKAPNPRNPSGRRTHKSPTRRRIPNSSPAPVFI
jgi:hypothetical protein